LNLGGDAASQKISRIDQSISIVAESGQITDRRKLRLKSRAQISDGLARWFFVVRGKNLRRKINALPSLKTIEWE
jgi:hypothetical protein